ncbi:MAG TPA: hypothetical protein VHG28_16540 [Longimicrobiaceae bacterium]|nr:hypothetical protein [Longimicrobiaceae bacterium]
MRRGAGAAGSGRGGILQLLTALLLLLTAPAATAQVGGESGGPRVLAVDSLRVVFWPRAEGRAREVLAAARRPLLLPGFPGRRPPLPATIILAPSQAVWDSLLGGAVPEWGAGVAIPSERTIVLPLFASPRTDPGALGTTLRHELIHLALHRELPGPIPRWFDEGYAQWASGGWDEERAWQLRVAFLLGRAPPLDSLSLDWPRGEERARLAYLLSATAVRHLAERSGPGGFEVLIEAWRREGSLDRAIRSAYGMTMGQFEEEWARSVRRRYGWLLLGTQTAVFWLFATLCLFLLFYLRRRRDRAKLAEMRAEERMLPPPRPDGVDVEYPLE